MLKKYVLLILFGLCAAPLYASERNLKVEHPGQTQDDLTVTDDEIERAQELRSWFENGLILNNKDGVGQKFQSLQKGNCFTFDKNKHHYVLAYLKTVPTTQPRLCAGNNKDCAHENVNIQFTEKHNEDFPLWECTGNIGIMKNGQNLEACKPIERLPTHSWLNKSGLIPAGSCDFTKLYDIGGSKNNMKYQLSGSRFDSTGFDTPMLNPFFIYRTTNKSKIFAYQKSFTHACANVSNIPRVKKHRFHIAEKRPQETHIVARIAPITVCAALVLQCGHFLSSLWQGK